MESIIINGAPVEIPPEVIADSRDAAQAWCERQIAAAEKKAPIPVSPFTPAPATPAPAPSSSDKE